MVDVAKTFARLRHYRYRNTPHGKAAIDRCRAEHVPVRCAKRKAFIDSIKIGRGCADCGYNLHPAALHFDHLPGKKKRFHVSGMLHRSEAAILAEIAQCEVVCANCHAIRTVKRRRR